MQGGVRTAGIKEEVFRSLLVQKIEFYDQNQVPALHNHHVCTANVRCESPATNVLRYEVRPF